MGGGSVIVEGRINFSCFQIKDQGRWSAAFKEVPTPSFLQGQSQLPHDLKIQPPLDSAVRVPPSSHPNPGPAFVPR